MEEESVDELRIWKASVEDGEISKSFTDKCVILEYVLDEEGFDLVLSKFSIYAETLSVSSITVVLIVGCVVCSSPSLNGAELPVLIVWKCKTLGPLVELSVLPIAEIVIWTHMFKMADSSVSEVILLIILSKVN